MSLKEIKTIEEFEEELMQSIQSSTQDTHSTDKKDTNIASYPEDTNVQTVINLKNQQKQS